ncbi:MAG: FCD domain-containing protein [Oscillospiraceae bacterium]
MKRDELEYSILRTMKSENFPMGASFLSLKIPEVSQANIGRVLQELEFSGYVSKISNKGRVISEQGMKYFDTLEAQMSSSEYLDELCRMVSAQDKKVYLDILNARIILERYTVTLATENATAQELRELRTILENQRYVQSLGGLGEEENLIFHNKLAAIAGNSVVEQLLKIIMHKKYAYKHFSALQYKVSENSNFVHFEILEAMEGRDAEKAADCMCQHIGYLITSIQELDYSH